MKLIPIAKLLYKRVNDSNLFFLYDTFMKLPILKPIRESLSVDEIIKVIFLAREIGENRNPANLIPKLNNIFVFSNIEFLDDDNYIDCGQCGGNAEFPCEYCNNGNIRCDECDGDGDVECDECGGYGEYEDGTECDKCSGRGKTYCENCDGEGYLECQECGGYGYVTCDMCDGSGEVETSDYIPYNISIYVSINQNLLTTLEKNLIRNEPIDYSSDNETSFILHTVNVGAGDGDTEYVKPEFMNETYLNGINESLSNLTTINVHGNFHITDSTLDYPNNKFLY